MKLSGGMRIDWTGKQGGWSREETEIEIENEREDRKKRWNECLSRKKQRDPKNRDLKSHYWSP
jgi:hypothetical protein